MKVCKFGGSSMSNAYAVACVEKIIRADESRRYIVVSAPGKRDKDDKKVTDLLYLAKDKFDRGENFFEVFEVIKTRFLDLEIELQVDAKLECELEEIKDKIAGGASRDFVASRGEYLSAKLLAKKLDVPFCDTQNLVWFEGDNLALDKTIENLSAKLKSFERAVLPGFYGSNALGIKTFTRGGSDITGALVAAAVRADVYENWTDVDGIFTADPRKDTTARFVEKLTYKEMYTLALRGANVLHKDAVYPVEAAGIKINVRNTFNPDCKGTIIAD